MKRFHMYYEPILPLPALEGRDLQIVTAVGSHASLGAVSNALKTSPAPALHWLRRLEKLGIVRCVREWVEGTPN